MNHEEKIKHDIIKKFESLSENIRIQGPRRIYLNVDYAVFEQVFDFLKNKLDFSILLTMTGLDEGDKFSVIYHLSQDNGIILNLKTSVSRENPVLKSIMPFFVNAEIYEREIVDLFGFKVEGLPPGNRYPLPDNWGEGGCPLRKDWKPKKSDVQEVK